MSLSKKYDVNKENVELKKQISKLQKAVSDLSIKNIFLERTIEVAERVLEYIKEIRRSGINCGPHKLQKYLNHNFDLEIGRDRLFTLMGKHDLQCKYYHPYNVELMVKMKNKIHNKLSQLF